MIFDNQNRNNNATNQTMNMTNPVHIGQSVVNKELQIALAVILIIAGLSVNTLLVLLATMRRRYLLLANVAVSNYIAIITLSLRVVNLWSNNKVDGEDRQCVLIVVVTELWWCSQNYTLLAISYERYRPIANPFQSSLVAWRRMAYPKRRCYYVGAIWIITICLVLTFLAKDIVTFEYDSNILRCRKNWEDHRGYTLIYSLVSFLFPGIMFLYFNGFMFYKGYKTRQMDPRLFATGSVARSWSFSSLASLRGFITGSQPPVPSFSQSGDSLPSWKSGGKRASGRRLGSFSTQTSILSSTGNQALSSRKRNTTDRTFKPLLSTLLMVVPYLLATIPEVVLMYLRSEKQNPSQEVDVIMGSAKFLVVAYFPVVLCATDTKVRRDIRVLVNRTCFRTGRISPHVNIDSRDYPENIERRDSRRSSVVSQHNNNNNNTTNPLRMTSGEKEANSHLMNKNGKNIGPSMTDNIFFIDSTPINMPTVDA